MAGFLATVQLSLACPRAFFQRTKECYKRSFVQRFNGCIWKMIGDYEFIDVLDDVINSPNLAHAVHGPSRVSGLDQKTIVVKCYKLIEKIIADGIALAPRLNCGPSIPLEPGSTDDIQRYNLESNQKVNTTFVTSSWNLCLLSQR